MAERTKGRVVQVMGPVVDIEFPTGDLPEIYYAVAIPRDGGQMVVEVQQHLGNDWVRCVAMDATEGLRRGMEAITKEMLDIAGGAEALSQARARAR